MRGSADPRRVLAVLVSLALAAGGPAAAQLESKYPMGPERVADVAARLAMESGGKRGADDLMTRTMAVTLAFRMLPHGDIYRLQKDEFLGRVYKYARDAQKLVDAIEATPMPKAHREVLVRHYIGRIVYPLRYRTADAPVQTWSNLIQSIPPDSTLLAVPAGESLHAALTAHWSGWTDTPAVARKAVVDRLAAINPRLRPGRSFRAPRGPVRDGFAAGTGVDAMVHGGWDQLAALVPALDIKPAGQQQIEQVVLPIDDRQVWVVQYRLNPSDLLVPPPEVLAGWANPRELVLRNLPLTDLACLEGLRPLKLDLSGTDIADIAALADHTQLLELDLSACPVTDISPLRRLTGLRRLNLWGTGVSDLAPLASLPLARLDIELAPVKNLAPLADLPLELLLLDEDAPYTNLQAVARLGKIGDVPFDQWRNAWQWKRKAGPYWDEVGAASGPRDCDEKPKSARKPRPGKTPARPPPVVQPEEPAVEVPEVGESIDLIEF